MLTCCSGVDIFVTDIYRTCTPPKNLRECFLGELDDFIFQLITGYSRIFVCGDINFHIENPGDSFAKQFMAQLSDFGLTDHVSGRPTHWMYYCLKTVLVSTPRSTIYKFPIIAIFSLC